MHGGKGYGQPPNGMYQVPPGYAPQGGFAPMQPGMGAPMHPGMGPPGGMYMSGPPQGYPQQGYMQQGQYPPQQQQMPQQGHDVGPVRTPLPLARRALVVQPTSEPPEI